MSAQAQQKIRLKISPFLIKADTILIKSLSLKYMTNIRSLLIILMMSSFLNYSENLILSKQEHQNQYYFHSKFNQQFPSLPPRRPSHLHFHKRYLIKIPHIINSKFFRKNLYKDKTNFNGPTRHHSNPLVLFYQKEHKLYREKQSSLQSDSSSPFQKLRNWRCIQFKNENVLCVIKFFFNRKIDVKHVLSIPIVQLIPIWLAPVSHVMPQNLSALVAQKLLPNLAIGDMISLLLRCSNAHNPQHACTLFV